MRSVHQNFIMIDGIAGSGKSTIAKAVQDIFSEKNKKVFSLNDWFANHTEPPKYTDIKEYDIYLTHEPSRSWIGSALREELFRTDDPYEPVELAHAFALDRHILYKRFILPALSDGKMIIQERGVFTSIVYQARMPNGPSEVVLKELPGNAFALQHVPAHLIVCAVDVATAQKRVLSRGSGRGTVGLPDLLERVQARLTSEDFNAYLSDLGTARHVLDTNKSQEEALSEAKKIITSIFNLE